MLRSFLKCFSEGEYLPNGLLRPSDISELETKKMKSRKRSIPKSLKLVFGILQVAGLQITEDTSTGFRD